MHIECTRSFKFEGISEMYFTIVSNVWSTFILLSFFILDFLFNNLTSSFFLDFYRLNFSLSFNRLRFTNTFCDNKFRLKLNHCIHFHFSRRIHRRKRGKMSFKTKNFRSSCVVSVKLISTTSSIWQTNGRALAKILVLSFIIVGTKSKLIS
jgi:hypothetical protein